tara:strand:- start:513 stop:2159 length:1647 start_codon:yes stop_codon:yes gene_type:complete
MAYLRDRRAFGNIGTRKFRGARFGDPLSPRGPQYTLEGRVLDYSTDVGPFTIVDQSGEGNTATLYSGRGLTMDAVNDTVTYATDYSLGSQTATVWMRVDTLGTRALGSTVGGGFLFTPTATGVWEELTYTRLNIEGDLLWLAGSDCDIGDLRVGTEHWTHNDWSDPTGDTSNGKTIVDSGPNQLHGTCTGCSGFTGEATIPQTADKNWNKYVGLGGAEQGAVGYSTFTPVSYGFDGTLASGVGVAGFTLPATAQIGDSFKICVDITSDQSPSCQFRSNAGSTSIASNSVLLSVGHNEITLTLTAAGNFVSVSEGDSPSTITVRNFTAELISGTAQASVMVSTTDANDQIDAFGTAILEPRLNTQQLNLFGDGEYSSTPDSASLDLTTTATWEVWGNFYGAAPASTQAILSKTRFSGNERTADITKSSATADNTVNFTASSNGLGGTIFSKTLTVTDKLSHIVFTYDGATQTMVGYIDGVLTAFSATSGTVTTSLFTNTQPYMIGARPSVDPAANYAPFKIGSSKIYNRALTADEVLTNYNTQKSLYGL